MALEQRIQSLKKRRSEISDLIHNETAHLASDPVRLRQLKRERLFLKDEMRHLLHVNERERAA